MTKDAYKIPGPGNYNVESSLRQKKIQIKFQQEPRSLIEKLEKTDEPGPGHYDFEIQQRSQDNIAFPVSPRFQQIPLSPN